MTEMSEVRHLGVSISRNVEAVYVFLANPANLPQWASGLGALRNVDGQWIAETPEGPISIRFCAPNRFGILDHWVTPPSGAPIYLPFRVVANGDGCELIFTLFRQPDMDQEKYEADTEWVMRDLNTAKRLLEAA